MIADRCGWGGRVFVESGTNFAYRNKHIRRFMIAKCPEMQGRKTVAYMPCYRSAIAPSDRREREFLRALISLK